MDASPPRHTGRTRASGRSFALPVEVSIRRCRRADLPLLEWHGLFWRHRAIFREAFARQRRHDALLLLATVNDFPVGQVFMDFAVRRSESAAVLWAVRVYPFLQGMGIGTRLLAAAEDELRRRGIAWAELGVERSNAAARRLYERLGYTVVGDMHEECEYVRPDDRVERMLLDEWRMRKWVGAPLPMERDR